MISGKTFKWSATAATLLLFLVAGCAQQTATSTTYKLVTDAQRKIEYEGTLANDPAFKSGLNQKKIEMTFTQQVQKTNEKGNEITKITIKELKYFEKNKGNLVQAFDSTKGKDQKNFMAKLIGTSYTIEVTPSGKVIKVVDISEPKKAIIGPPSVRKYAARLINPEAIKQRHGNIIMPQKNTKKLKKDDKWSDTDILSFGMMGAKSYEKIYTVQNIESKDNTRIAVVEMQAIPSKEQNQQQPSDIPEMFDTSDKYMGQLKLNLDTGKVEHYAEKLQSEWLVVDPEASKKNQNPDAVKMTATRFYKLDKVD